MIAISSLQPFFLPNQLINDILDQFFFPSSSLLLQMSLIGEHLFYCFTEHLIKLLRVLISIKKIFFSQSFKVNSLL